MEILIFALVASYNAYQQQEWVVAEPEEFQPFNLQALRNFADNKPSWSLSRRRHTDQKSSNVFDYGLKI
jgi:hypothetical protein